MTADKIFLFIALLCMAGVVGSFFLGMVAMTKGQEKDHKNSNKMMRMRVGFQGLTLVFLFLAYLAK